MRMELNAHHKSNELLAHFSPMGCRSKLIWFKFLVTKINYQNSNAKTGARYTEVNHEFFSMIRRDNTVFKITNYL